MRRWLLPAVLLFIGLGSAVGVARAQSQQTAGKALTLAAPPKTPVLSARRAAPLLAQTTARVRLDGALAAAFTDPALGPGRDSSCLVVSQGDQALFTRGADQRLIPASNMKLLTALAALQRLGPDFRFVTEVRADHAPANGVVDGNLYLVGSGDPLIQTADYNARFERPLPDGGYTHLEALAAAVVAAGVHRVTGAVVGDESRYDGQRYVPSWKTTYIADGEVGPLSALDVNDGFVTANPARAVPAPSPAVLASGSLNALLEKSGNEVAGEPTQGPTPPGAVLVASLPSPPLGTIVAEMLRESDNQTAELLVKELGRRFGGAGTTAAGVGVVRQTVAQLDLPVGALSGVDGSGLDRSDRASCSLLAAVLQKAGPDSPLAAGLPVAATSGTLTKRFVGSPAAGRLAAKTGSLDHVSALSGFVRATGPGSGPPPLAFSLIVNNTPTDAAGVALGDRVGIALAGYPSGPAAAALGPQR